MRTHRRGFLIVLAVCAALLSGCAPAGIWTADVSVTERDPRPQELVPYPGDGIKVGVNPPGFTWNPSENAKAYRLELRRAGGASVLSTLPLTSTVYAHHKTFRPGDYEWQVVYLDGENRALGVSKTRRFAIPAGLPELPMPDVGVLREELARVRPRIFLRGKRIEEIKAAVAAGEVKWWKPFIEMADAALEEKLYPEPAGYTSAEFSVVEWRRMFMPAKVGSAHVARTALAYRLTGDPKYLEAARRWMLNIASWDPKGSTSFRLKQPNGSDGNTEAAMPILDRMGFGWDWIGDKLTPEERKKVIAAMTVRGNDALNTFKQQDFHSRPFSNHEGRFLAFLGNSALAFLGDIPEAEQWLDYVVRAYLTSYPGWGGDEGGWAQGMGYWSAYVYYLTTYAEALRGATPVDLFHRPFYRNTGYMPVYFQPPYSTRGAFGDGGDRGPSASQQVLVERFAEVLNDPVLRWHARAIPAEIPAREKGEWREFLIEDVGAVLRARPGAGKGPAKPPTELDGSRHLADIGWVAMHSALGDAQNDVWALFKASRFGSFSHSHGDQNTFQLNAYGRPLLIDSGYYPWYGSPHDQLWTRQTRAHNGILVNGRGQPPGQWAASGSIDTYERHGIITLVRGQAAQAYNQAFSDGFLKLWRKSLKEPLPNMTPEVDSFERTLAFVGSKEKPVLVVHDYLKTAAPATFDWLLHALSRMETDARNGTIWVRDGDARLVVRVISTRGLAFSQTDRFSPMPEIEGSGCADKPKDCAARFAGQWHLAARTQAPADEIRFLAVMAPFRASEKEPAIETFREGDSVGFRVAGTEVAAWWGAGKTGKIAAGGISGEGRMVVRVKDSAGSASVVSQ